MRIVLTLFLFCVCMSIKAQQQDMTEMKKAIDLMQGMYDITFVYDSSLVTAKPQAFPSAGNSLKENLERIFGGTGIKWEIRDEYVLLFHPNNYTFSGYVCEDSGETLINVTVLDLNTLKGTLSNEHGFFSITLPEGKHKFRFSYIGYQDVVKEVDLSSNYNGVIYLKESSTALKEVVVVADMNAPLRTTQTGKVSLTSEQLNTEFSLLSSPDLVKTLQNLPGVASGTELLSGMYVHGGKNDENLFLLDGTPLYQINHLGGLFSAFNTDIIKNVDLYKSGFPARYGGRLSSVVDVRTKEGNMKEFENYDGYKKELSLLYPVPLGVTIENGINRVYVKTKKRKFTAQIGMRGNQQAIRVNASKKVLWGWVEYTTAYYWKYTPNGPVQFGKEVKSGHDIMILGNPFPNGAKLYMWTRGTGEENCGIMTVQL